MKGVLPFAKPTRLESADYLRFIRRQGCLIDGASAQAHHLEAGGIGTKGSDFRTVPLCVRCHHELHKLGKERFEDNRRVDLFRESFRLLEVFTAALVHGENLGGKEQ